MANVFNTLLATTVANANEERRRQAERYDQAAANTSQAVSQQLALRKQEEDAQKAEAQKVGAAAELTHEGGAWSYDNPELRHQGEVGALSERADMQKQQISAKINADKLAEVLRGKVSVAEVQNQGKENVAALQNTGKENVANIGAGASNYRADTGAEASKYGADERSNAMIEAARLRANATQSLPGARSFYQQLKDYNTGAQGKNVTSINQLIQHIGRFLDNARQIRNSPLPLVNQVKNRLLGQEGDPRITKLMEDAHLVGSEASRTFQGVGTVTENEKATLAKFLDANASPEQMEGAANETWQLALGKLGALQAQRENIFRAPGDYQFLSPESKNTLQAHGLNEGGKTPGSPGTDPHAGMESKTINGETRYWNGSAWVE